ARLQLLKHFQERGAQARELQIDRRARGPLDVLLVLGALGALGELLERLLERWLRALVSERREQLDQRHARLRVHAVVVLEIRLGEGVDDLVEQGLDLGALEVLVRLRDRILEELFEPLDGPGSPRLIFELVDPVLRLTLVLATDERHTDGCDTYGGGGAEDERTDECYSRTRRAE